MALTSRSIFRWSRPVVASRRSTAIPLARLAARRRIRLSPPGQGFIFRATSEGSPRQSRAGTTVPVCYMASSLSAVCGLTGLGQLL